METTLNKHRKLNQSRRIWLHGLTGIAMAAPLALFADRACATQNAALRQALKYQDAPQAGKQCSACAQFVPGKTPKDKGACTVMPGDDEISPSGYCVAWIEAKKK